MRYALFLTLLSPFAVQAAELKLELEGKGMAGNQVRVAIYSANAPEQLPTRENGRQDKNFLGVPKEICSFSNNARGMFGPPDFAAAAFEIGENAVTQSIHLH